ncbi:class I fructose-bisphosphate aldolase [Sulfuracidifex tepidarius]|uniref:2-amino-3,7-dideoxy-D-threo-hept-6-ulosonate synthase n=1 Tax=Sulfuracidifex tepidarius TaxID=1294262 RepID=A0A510DX26_9CREN|nr:aldolase [Sulfuracidifex tepidarius]BBG24739.1 2-amino-3,7-dideoxy-D-threo-hept-6-ulosonate synthase [Sulfuracidifex tepidarius]BBG27528.1 2-amino-3,7-dideoxy-D-threo-hept-6-ulosonate synthase [Sulfuracidifex tepidarius]
MSGLEIRLKRLFQNERAFVVALDHGLVMGPMKGLESPAEVVPKLRSADALQMSPPMVKIVKENFFSRSSPMLIARLDTANVWRDKYLEHKEGYYSQLFTVKDAIKAGADAVVTYLVVGYDSDQVEGYNLESLASIRVDAEDFGIPFIVEPLYVVRGNPDSVKEVEMVKYVTRLASELGADILKVDYTGKNFSEVVKVAFSPILIRGGPKTSNDSEFLSMLKEALSAGAKGITVGRNLWQSKDPEAMAKSIARLVHENADIGQILKELELS